MKLLIVNGDDFGLTQGVNRAIIDAHTQGILTSATLMANMHAFDDAVRLAKENSSLGVGLHFNITQGKPVAESSRVPSLLNREGEFLGTSTALFRRALIGRLRIKEVEIELQAQIEKVQNAGLQLTHIDSHKHAHILPTVFEAISQIAPDYGIHAIRLPREGWRTGEVKTLKLLKQGIVALGLSQLSRMNAATLRRANLNSTDAFFGIRQTGFWSKAWLLKLIENLPEGVSELMCHPGYEDGELGQIKTRLRESRLQELSLLTDREVIEALHGGRIQAINFSLLGPK